MLVVPDAKSMVFPYTNENLHLQDYPISEVVEVQGNKGIFIPHNVPNTMLIHRLGYNPPSPIWYYYNWPSLFKPMQHQMETAAQMTLENKLPILNDIGTGKTLSSLWAADYLIKENMVHRWLVVAPLSNLQTVWANTLFMHMPHRSYTVLYGSADKRKRELAKNYEFYIINHEGLAVVMDTLMKRDDIHGVIFDEAAVMRNRKNVFKLFRKWLQFKNIQWRFPMTGTPTPNEPPDAWALGKIIDSKELGDESFTAFKERTMVKVSNFRWVAKDDAMQEVAKILTPSVRFKRKDCIDLPPTTFITLDAAMTKQQQAAFDDMVRHMYVEYEEGEINALNEAVKRLKLLQIASGVLYNTETGDALVLEPKNKLKVLKQVIDEDGGQVIVLVVGLR